MSERMKNCQLETPHSKYHDPYFDGYDIKQTIDRVKEILLYNIGPLVSAFGLLTNLLVIVTIFHNKKKYKNKQVAAAKTKADSKGRQHIVLLDEPMYKYMLLNSILNASYCLIFLLDLTIECQAPIINDGVIENFKKYAGIDCIIKDCVVLFTTSMLKLTSNVLIIEISINRYILLGKDHAPLLVRFSEIKIKKVVGVSLFFSILLSIVLVFQELFFTRFKNLDIYNFFFLNKTVSQNNLVTYDFYFYGNYALSLYEGIFDSKSLLGKLSQLTPLLVFTIIHDLVAYFLFCLFSLIMDISTLKVFKQLLTEHAKMSQKTKEDEKSERAEKKTFWMVLSFNLVNFILRLPDVFSSIFFIYTTQQPSVFIVLCLRFSRCLTLNELSNISYILSLGLNFFFYLVFNKNFKQSFGELYNKISRHLPSPKSNNQPNQTPINITTTQ